MGIVRNRNPGQLLWFFLGNQTPNASHPHVPQSWFPCQNSPEAVLLHCFRKAKIREKCLLLEGQQGAKRFPRWKFVFLVISARFWGCCRGGHISSTSKSANFSLVPEEAQKASFKVSCSTAMTLKILIWEHLTPPEFLAHNEWIPQGKPALLVTFSRVGNFGWFSFLVPVLLLWWFVGFFSLSPFPI